MLFRSRWMCLILGLLVVALAACGGSNIQSNPTFNKLVVFVSGLGSTLSEGDLTQNNGYGFDPAWGGIQTYLQGTSEFKGAQFMAFSYRGFTAEGKPDVFPCTDTFNNQLEFDASLLNLQIIQYLKGHPNTDVYIVSHSLGGVITFGYLAQLIEITHSNAIDDLNTRLGTLKGIAILDSPLGGVTNESNYVNAIIVKAFTCDFFKATKVDFTTIGGLQTLFNTASSLTHQGETASILNAFMGGKYITNEQVSRDAAKAGIANLIVGNGNDILWRPEVCGAGSDFLSTEYLQELGHQNNGGAVYSRSFLNPSGSLNGLIECPSLLTTGAHHSDVLHRTDVEKAIWETFTGNPMDQLTPVSNVPVAPLPTLTGTATPNITPTLSPSPTPTPTQEPMPTPILTAPSRLQGTLVQAPTTFQVALQITQTHTDGSFDGKWYATINGSEEDVIVNGVVVPFNESNRFSQISQDKVQQLQQQFGSNGTLLWFTSTSYDVGQDILLGCEYYGSLQTNGSVQGIWYPPGSSTEGGTFQLA